MVSNNGASHQTPVSFAPTDSITSADLFWQQLAQSPLEDTLAFPPSTSDRKKNRPVWTSTRKMPFPVKKAFMSIYNELYKKDGIDWTLIQCMVIGKGAAVMRSWSEYHKAVQAQSSGTWRRLLSYNFPSEFGLSEATRRGSFATFGSTRDLLRELQGTYDLSMSDLVPLCGIAGLTTSQNYIFPEKDMNLFQNELTKVREMLVFQATLDSNEHAPNY